MASIFTKIVNGDIPAYKVAETEDFLAFLDIRPMSKGHSLVIPKQEIDYLYDLPDGLYVGIHVFAREVAKAIEQVVDCKRIGVAVVGLEVPHAHIHLIPINEVSDLSFDKPPVEMEPGELQALAEQIRERL